MLKEDPVSQVTSHHYAGISTLEKMFNPIKDSSLVRFAPLYVTVNPAPLVKPPWIYK